MAFKLLVTYAKSFTLDVAEPCKHAIVLAVGSLRH